VTDPTDAAERAALAALRSPATPESLRIEAAGIPFHVSAWGPPGASPLLLVHGITSNAGTWWRIGPALAAAGHRVIAPDLPAHGLTGSWSGDVAFRDTAEDLAAFARAAFPDAAPGDVDVVGHS
jgi:pimeloyl-ACP methyl ester carboxylesterase